MQHSSEMCQRVALSSSPAHSHDAVSNQKQKVDVFKSLGRKLKCFWEGQIQHLLSYPKPSLAL